MLLRFCSAVLLVGVLPGQNLHVTGEKIRAHVKYLASDQLEGRGVGTNGEKLATDYLAAQLQASGVKPAGNNNTYFQRVPLLGVTTLAGATLTANGKMGRLSLKLKTDYVGTATSQRPDNDFDAEAVFVGHGISAPEFGWDDYKGQDVRGKVLIFFTNEPPSNDPKFFAGPSLTYYGRWVYKFEEATRRGAVAALIIHTTPTAGYGWGVLSGSDSSETPQLKLSPGENGLKLAGWLSESAGAQVMAATGKSLAQLLDMANQKSFRPMPVGIHIAGHIPVRLRSVSSRNVVGRVDGSGPLQAQAVMYSAHWDHLGISLPVNGDRIYNGAVDNATGCAVVLEIARIWATLPKKPNRSGLFVFVTAEEAGLLGSKYYGEHAVVAPGQTAADLNYDALYPFGKTSDISAVGSERTTLWPLVQRDAARFHLLVAPDPEPGQGHYYRSDHFSLARVGVPAFSIDNGAKYIGKPADFGKTIFEQYNSTHYHQPSDEYRPDWDFTGMEQMADFGLTLGIDIANLPELPTWTQGDEFLRPRQNSGVR